jgi:hypothetical protein
MYRFRFRLRGAVLLIALLAVILAGVERELRYRRLLAEKTAAEAALKQSQSLLILLRDLDSAVQDLEIIRIPSPPENDPGVPLPMGGRVVPLSS